MKQTKIACKKICVERSANATIIQSILYIIYINYIYIYKYNIIYIYITNVKLYGWKRIVHVWVFFISFPRDSSSRPPKNFSSPLSTSPFLKYFQCNAMQHQNTLFPPITPTLPWTVSFCMHEGPSCCCNLPPPSYILR